MSLDQKFVCVSLRFSFSECDVFKLISLMIPFISVKSIFVKCLENVNSSKVIYCSPVICKRISLTNQRFASKMHFTWMTLISSKRYTNKISLCHVSCKTYVKVTYRKAELKVNKHFFLTFKFYSI